VSQARATRASGAAPITELGPPAAPRHAVLTVIVPTRNEEANVAPLCEQLERVLPDDAVEVLFVDDSDDDTPGAVRAAQRSSSREIRLIHRAPGERRNGLGGAVVEGLRCARAPWVCVMDGDLQHPPSLIGELLDEARSGSRDLVVASRFRPGGDADQFAWARRALSWLSTRGARVLFPHRLRGVSDPMSGFFLVRRGAIDLDALRPRGFKVLVEILVRTPRLRVSEVGFHFGERLAGESKAGLREAGRYVAQLLDARVAPGSRRLGRFATIGLSGVVVNTAGLAVLAGALEVDYALAAVLATQLSTAWNYGLTERWVFRGRDCRRRGWHRAALFFATNDVALVARIPLLVALTSGLGLNYLVSNLVSLGALMLVRFGIAETWIWSDRTPSRERRATTTWSYDIHGIVSVESDARLPELQRFHVEELVTRPDIRVRVGGRRAHRPSENGHAHIRYTEALRRLGFEIDIQAGDRIDVRASRLVGLSPHVLYTNVVEPILRWTFVERGYALVHAACIADGDRALLVTARTDTGKTTTSLKVLDRSPLRFLSDDLTLLCPDGRVLAYPKPLTISRHTLHAVKTPLLTRRERAALIVQSRLHSRSGRRFALLLAKKGVPAGTINAITQLLVPPPKYHVDRLVPGVEIASEARVEGLAVIERGGTGTDRVSAAMGLLILLENCEDAYGFPPYSHIEHFLHSRDGADLRTREREIIGGALRGLDATVLRSETMDWAERIPDVLGPRPEEPASAATDERAATPAELRPVSETVPDA
jgi:dolichol-phosphate mannosyltransferase